MSASSVTSVKAICSIKQSRLAWRLRVWGFAPGRCDLAHSCGAGWLAAGATWDTACPSCVLIRYQFRKWMRLEMRSPPSCVSSRHQFREWVRFGTREASPVSQITTVTGDGCGSRRGVPLLCLKMPPISRMDAIWDAKSSPCVSNCHHRWKWMRIGTWRAPLASQIATNSGNGCDLGRKEASLCLKQPPSRRFGGNTRHREASKASEEVAVRLSVRRPQASAGI